MDERAISKESFETLAWGTEWQYGEYLTKLVGPVYFDTMKLFSDLIKYWGPEDPNICYNEIYRLDEDNHCNGYYFDCYEDVVRQWEPIGKIIYKHTWVYSCIEDKKLLISYRPPKHTLEVIKGMKNLRNLNVH
jgi:hypothetical protein